MGQKEKVDSRTLDEWECRIMKTVETRIDLGKKEKNNEKGTFYQI